MAIKMWCGILLLGLLAGVSGCAAEPAGPEGMEWLLAEMDGKPIGSSEARPASLLLNPDQQKASGFTGCNAFNAAYTIESSSLQFGPVASTRRACPDREAAVEAGYFRALGEVRSWKIADGALLLFDDGGIVLARFAAKQPEGEAADLQSLAVRSIVVPSGPVALYGGEYRQPAAPGSASEISIKLTDYRAFGELDGNEAGAVVLSSASGGSGSFSELALLAETDKGWENTDTLLLGDRVKIHSVAIQDDSIVVSMTTHGPDDPACCPTLEATRTFKVRENRLVAVDEPAAEEISVLSANAWQWAHTLYGDGNETVPDEPRKYTVQFKEDGQCAVKADCNNKGGSYSVQDKKLSITIMISTIAMCEEGSLEEPFVKDLSAVDGFILKDGELYLNLKYDSGTMKFSRVP